MLGYYQFAVGFLSLVFTWDMYLNLRQHGNLKDKNIPAAIKKIVEPPVFEKARLYGLDKSYFRMFQGCFHHAEILLSLHFGFLPFFWGLAGSVCAYFGCDETYEITQSLVFVYLTTFYSLAIELPSNIYFTFVLEQKHGFNKQTAKFYIKDQIKGIILNCVVTAVIIAPLLKIIEWGGEYFYIYTWAFFFLFSLFAITIYADFIAPLFDTFTPLEKGGLRTKIEKLAGPLNFPLTQIWVVDASNRSSHSNAYIYGFWSNKRIVLFDTLFPAKEGDEKKKDEKSNHIGCTDEEIVAVLSHELGHWKEWHTVKNFVIGQVNIFVTFMVFGMLMHEEEIYQAFGFVDGKKPVLIGLFLILQFIFAPINVVLGFLMTRFTRKNEFEADAFAKKLNYKEDLKSALIKLQIGNLGDMNPDWLYSSYHFSHPPLVERLQALDSGEDKKKSD